MCSFLKYAFVEKRRYYYKNIYCFVTVFAANFTKPTYIFSYNILPYYLLYVGIQILFRRHIRVRAETRMIRKRYRHPWKPVEKTAYVVVSQFPRYLYTVGMYNPRIFTLTVTACSHMHVSNII